MPRIVRINGCVSPLILICHNYPNVTQSLLHINQIKISINLLKIKYEEHTVLLPVSKIDSKIWSRFPCFEDFNDTPYMDPRSAREVRANCVCAPPRVGSVTDKRVTRAYGTGSPVMNAWRSAANRRPEESPRREALTYRPVDLARCATASFDLGPATTDQWPITICALQPWLIDRHSARTRINRTIQ